MLLERHCNMPSINYDYETLYSMGVARQLQWHCNAIAMIFRFYCNGFLNQNWLFSFTLNQLQIQNLKNQYKHLLNLFRSHIWNFQANRLHLF